MSKKRSDRHGDGKPLTDNPFAALSGLESSLPSAPAPEPAGETSARPAQTPPYRVAKTREGGLPIFVEKRAKGKTATVIRNVTGDAEALLRTLKKCCGAGGVIRDGDVEIQGDHRAAIEAFLRTL